MFCLGKYGAYGKYSRSVEVAALEERGAEPDAEAAAAPAAYGAYGAYGKLAKPSRALPS